MAAIQSVLIIGFGVIGRGAARGFAAAGIRTRVCSRRAGSLDDVPKGVEIVATLPEACPDLVIELVPEEIALKQAAYREVEAKYGDADYLIATGTSGLDLVELAKGMARPERLIALHYFMPADTVPLVEVMAGPASPREAVDRVADFMARTGKLPLRMYKPVIGLLVNRLQHAILHEAYRMIDDGVCTAADVDLVATSMLGPRMCSTGLILQKDLSGLKVHREAQQAIVPDLCHDNTPTRIVPDLVSRGETGIAAGRGFYDWSGFDAAAVRGEAAASLSRLLAYLNDNTYKDSERFAPTLRQRKT